MELLTIICNLLGPSILKHGFNVPNPKLSGSSGCEQLFRLCRAHTVGLAAHQD